jgi:ATP synthase protein I
MLKQAIKPFRAVFLWQALATVVLALVAGYVAGWHGTLSATLGGLIGIAAGLAFVIAVALSRGGSAGAIIGAALRAEAVKIVLTIALLWLVLATYPEVVAVGFIGAFAVSVVIFSLVAFARVQQVHLG